MDMKNMIQRMTEIETSKQLNESAIAECGMPGSTPSTPPSMNVSFSAQGMDQIQDLLGLMKNAGLSQAQPAAAAMMPMRQDMDRLRAIVDKPEMEADAVYSDVIADDEDLEEWDNEPEPEYQDHKYMTKDLAGGINREKRAYRAAQRGDNAMAVESEDEMRESIKQALMKSLSEKKAKPDFLDMDKDGNKKEPMKKAAKDAKKKTNEDIGKAVSHGIKAAGEVGDSAVKGVAKAAGYASGLPKGLKKAYKDGQKKASGDDENDDKKKKTNEAEVEQVDEVSKKTAISAYRKRQRHADDWYSEPDDQKKADATLRRISKNFGSKTTGDAQHGVDIDRKGRGPIDVGQDYLFYKQDTYDRLAKPGTKKGTAQRKDYMKLNKGTFKKPPRFTEVAEGSGPKEKQKTPYRDINSPEYRAAVDKQKQQMAKDKAAEPGKKMLAKQGVAEGSLNELDTSTLKSYRKKAPVKEAEFQTPSHELDDTARKAMNIAQMIKRKINSGEKMDDMDYNQMAELGHVLSRFGTNFGPQSMKDVFNHMKQYTDDRNEYGTGYPEFNVDRFKELIAMAK